MPCSCRRGPAELQENRTKLVLQQPHALRDLEPSPCPRSTARPVLRPGCNEADETRHIFHTRTTCGNMD
eukprot:10121106-Lingulodinium_polyedra.AAC.1